MEMFQHIGSTQQHSCWIGYVLPAFLWKRMPSTVFKIFTVHNSCLLVKNLNLQSSNSLLLFVIKSLCISFQHPNKNKIQRPFQCQSGNCIVWYCIYKFI